MWGRLMRIGPFFIFGVEPVVIFRDKRGSLLLAVFYINMLVGGV